MLKPETTSLGWGRAAAMRFVKSEAEIKADIMKALEGKLSAEFQVYSIFFCFSKVFLIICVYI